MASTLNLLTFFLFTNLFAVLFIHVHASLLSVPPIGLWGLCVWFLFCYSLLIVLTGNICSNTDLSDLSIVGTCDIFVYQTCHKVI